MRYTYHEQCHCRRCKIMRSFYNDMAFLFVCLIIIMIGTYIVVNYS